MDPLLSNFYVTGLSFFLHSFFFIWKTELQIERTRQIGLGLTGLFPKWLHWLGLGHAELRSQEFHLSPSLCVRVSSTWLSFTAFPGVLARTWIRNEAAETQTSVYMGCLYHRCDLTTFATTLALPQPFHLFLRKHFLRHTSSLSWRVTDSYVTNNLLLVSN